MNRPTNLRPASFPIAALRFRLRSEGLVFRGFSGSNWHGGLGMMLQRLAPSAFRALYSAPDSARLYALRPPLAEAFPVGDELELQLSLFGAASAHVLACTQAINLLGEAGIDPAGHYRLQQASVLRPDGDAVFFTAADGLLTPPSSSDLGDWLTPVHAPREVRVRLLTPLRIKEGGDLVRDTPTYAQLLHRLLGRLDQLAHVMAVDTPLAKSERGPLFEEAQQVQLLDADLHWQRLDRRSARTRQQMGFGGLLGQLRFSGDMALTLPWLLAGQHVQIGGKTAFGFGAYAVETLA